MDDRAKKIYQAIEEKKARSAWMKGVKNYALDLVANDDVAFIGQSIQEIKKQLLNGADDWQQYSEGGLSLCYDSHIAAALCSPSELKKTKNGQRNPNKYENWIDVQARVLSQAWWMIRGCLENIE